MFLAAVSVVPPRPILRIARGAGRVHLADLHAEIGVVLLVLLDADELEAVVAAVFSAMFFCRTA